MHYTCHRVNTDSALAHYGVKGMRWGHHNAISSVGQHVNSTPHQGAASKPHDKVPEGQASAGSVADQLNLNNTVNLDQMYMQNWLKDRYKEKARNGVNKLLNKNKNASISEIGRTAKEALDRGLNKIEALIMRGKKSGSFKKEKKKL